MDSSFWDACCAEYRRRLREKYPADVLRKAFDSASSQYPQWFPTLGQFAELCDYGQKNTAHRAQPDHMLGEEKPYTGEGAAQARGIIEALAGKMGS